MGVNAFQWFAPAARARAMFCGGLLEQGPPRGNGFLRELGPCRNVAEKMPFGPIAAPDLLYSG
jgi:hypothetical protein